MNVDEPRRDHVAAKVDDANGRLCNRRRDRAVSSIENLNIEHDKKRKIFEGTALSILNNLLKAVARPLGRAHRRPC